MTMMRRFAVLLAVAAFTLGSVGCAGAADTTGKPAAKRAAPKVEATAKTATGPAAVSDEPILVKAGDKTYKVYRKWPFDAKEAKRRQEETAKALGVPVNKTIAAGGLEMVLVPAGEFMMGSPATELGRDRNEGPQHRVRITKPFYIGKFAITQRQWTNLGEKNWSRWRFVGDCRESPVEWVSWDDCQRFLKKLNALVKEKGAFALPTEAEWEYACRAGTATPFHFGETISTDQANYNGDYVYGKGPKGVYRKTTVKSGSFKPNTFGLYDMHGNVWEWCQDRYSFDCYKNSGTNDPQGPAQGDERVLRGGAWTYEPGNCRSAARVKTGPKMRDIFFGFRVVFRIIDGKEIDAAAVAKIPVARVDAPKPAKVAEPAAPKYKIYTKWPFDAKEAVRRQQETAKALGIPKVLTFEIGFGQKLEFILVPAGEFVMGSPKKKLKRKADEDQHRVRITKPFYLQKTEFTQAAYVILTMRGRSFGRNRSRYVDWPKPVEQITWHDMFKVIIDNLNSRGVGKFTLPTEAEWEYAARAGTTTPFHYGETISNDLANYNGYRVKEDGKTLYHTGGQMPWDGARGSKTFRRMPSHAGSFPANAFGFHDMHGNVWEACQDWYDKDYYKTGPKDDPKGPATGIRHVVRGGDWGISAVWDLRSAARKPQGPNELGSSGGFRLVLRTIKPQAALKTKPKAEPKR